MRARTLRVWCFFVALLFGTQARAKEAPLQVISWPTSGTAILQFSFGKFKEISTHGIQHVYTTDITVENLWNKKITSAEFVIYVYDKAKVRIGEGWISVTDVSPKGVIKFQTTVNASGAIASMEVVPQSLPPELQPALPPKTVTITVNSVPQGADFKLDGAASGTTPKVVTVGPGKHALLFSKEGFKPGTFPLEITQNDVSGGSVSYELGTAAYDTVELRDGSVLSGDVQSMTATEVMMRVGGTIQSIDRNKVKRIVLIEREPPTQ